MFAVLAAWPACAATDEVRWQQAMRVGEEALADGQWTVAESQFAAAVTLAESFGAADARLADSLTRLGMVHYTRGRNFQEVNYPRPIAGRSLDRAELLLIPLHATTAPTPVDRLADYRAQGAFALAEPVFRRALAVLASGPDSAAKADALNNLGATLSAQGKYVEGLTLLQRAEAIQHKALPEQDARQAVVKSNLAACLMSCPLPTGELDYYMARAERLMKAERLLVQARDIREAAHGRNSKQVALVLTTLASLYTTGNGDEVAKRRLQRALDIVDYDRKIGDPDVYAVLNQLIWVYRDLANEGAQESLLRNAVFNAEIAYGTHHPKIVPFLTRLGWFYRLSSKRHEAEPLLYRAVNIQQSIFGKDSHEYAAALENLAWNAGGNDDGATEEDRYQRALNVRMRLASAESLPFADALFHFAFFYRFHDRQGRMAGYLTQAQQLYTKLLGPHCPEVAAVLDAKREVVTTPAEELALHRQRLEAKERAFGKDHPQLAPVLTALGRRQELDGDPHAAQAYYQRAAAIEMSSDLKSPALNEQVNAVLVTP